MEVRILWNNYGRIQVCIITIPQKQLRRPQKLKNGPEHQRARCVLETSRSLIYDIPVYQESVVTHTWKAYEKIAQVVWQEPHDRTRHTP